jgi:hypothetical protein
MSNRNLPSALIGDNERLSTYVLTQGTSKSQSTMVLMEEVLAKVIPQHTTTKKEHLSLCPFQLTLGLRLVF